MSNMRLRSIIPLVTVAAIVGCAASSPDSGNGANGASPPAKIATVAWPTDVTQVRGLMTRLPRSFDGLTSEGPTENALEDNETGAPTGSIFEVSFDDGRVESPGVNVEGPVKSPLREILGLLVWGGCPQQCPDLQGSPTVLAAMKSNYWKSGTPGDGSSDSPYDISPPPSEFLWASFTIRYGIDSGETYAPDEQSHVVVWAADNWIYYVGGRGTDQRDRLVAAAAAAREGSAVVKPLE